MKKKEIKDQYGRLKGAEWFPLLHSRDVFVLGQGGIGSWTSLLLSRVGCSLHLFDMDIYEEHNMTGQIVGKDSIGTNKALAMQKVIEEMSPDCRVECYGMYDVNSPTNEIVVCGFDNMEARKVAFNNWKEYIEDSVGDEKDHHFFQDGRLLAEQLQIFSIPGNRKDLIELYEKEYLFDDAEVQEADCTFKQTSHCAAMIASHMVGFLTNWITNVYNKDSMRQVPFKYEYMLPLNLLV